MTLTVVFALAAAFSNAVNLMTQHSASVGAPKREGLASGHLPGPAAAVAARRGRCGELVHLPGPRPPQRPAVSGPAPPRHRTGLRPGVASGLGPPGRRRRR